VSSQTEKKKNVVVVVVIEMIDQRNRGLIYAIDLSNRDNTIELLIFALRHPSIH
jgi:hypothetical protein